MRMALFDQVPEASPVGVNQTRVKWNPSMLSLALLT